MAIFRFGFLAFLKLLGYIAYPSKLNWVSAEPRKWDDVSLLLVLNHTSLFEFIYGVALPFKFLWALSCRLVMPVADKTLDKPFMGAFFYFLAPKTMRLSRKRDDSWLQFIEGIHKNDICIFMPEGQMKRKNGLDKHGREMKVKTGVYDLLKVYEGKNMVIVYSKGLHHVFAPGDRIPKLFKSIQADLEYIPVNDYLSQFKDDESVAKTVAQDLQRRRDHYC